MQLFEKAILEHRIETVEFLIENGMRPDIGDFYLAIRENLYPVVTAMVPCIDFNECSKEGRRDGTPLHQVRSLEVAEFLVNAGFPVDVPDQEGLFPYQTVQDAEISAYLQKLYDELLENLDARKFKAQCLVLMILPQVLDVLRHSSNIQ